MSWGFLLCLALLVVLSILAEHWLKRRADRPLGQVLAVLGGGMVGLAGLLTGLGLRWPGLADTAAVFTFGVSAVNLVLLLGQAGAVQRLSPAGRWGLYALGAAWPSVTFALSLALLAPGEWAERFPELPLLALFVAVVLVWRAVSLALRPLGRRVRERWILPGPGERSSSGR